MDTLTLAAPEGWRFYHDQPMAHTGLLVSHDGRENFARWRPDAVVVHEGMRGLHCWSFAAHGMVPGRMLRVHDRLTGPTKADPGSCAQIPKYNKAKK